MRLNKRKGDTYWFELGPEDFQPTPGEAVCCCCFQQVPNSYTLIPTKEAFCLACSLRQSLVTLPITHPACQEWDARKERVKATPKQRQPGRPSETSRALAMSQDVVDLYQGNATQEQLEVLALKHDVDLTKWLRKYRQQVFKLTPKAMPMGTTKEDFQILQEEAKELLKPNATYEDIREILQAKKSLKDEASFYLDTALQELEQYPIQEVTEELILELAEQYDLNPDRLTQAWEQRKGVDTNDQQH